MVRTVTRRSTQTVTLSDVAAHANVSPQTVSRVIRSPNLVSAPTLERVRTAIAETGYVPNLAASNLASNRSMTIAAIVPAISASVFADALHGLDETLTDRGYHLFIGSTDYDPEREEELVRAFLGRRPDGFFIVGTRHTEAAARLLAGAKVPVVEAWNWTQTPIDSLVGFSNAAAIAGIVDAVVAVGYRHPTFAGSLQSADDRAVERSRSFTDSVRRMLPGEPARVVGSDVTDIDMATGARLLTIARERHPETDVLMFSSDVFAAGALLECMRRNIRVPGDLAITGFGDFEIARNLVPALTTVAIPNRDIGRRAGELLLSRMGLVPAGPASIDVGFSVVSREST